jgi:hypothetical protein
MIRFFSRRDWLAVWILWSAWCGITGWLLSAVGQLDRAGYAVTTLIFIAGVLAAFRFLPPDTARPAFLFRRSTYARLIPKLWLVLALLAFAGGLFYHPDNYDYLSYRFPRLLNWWAGHRWFWITDTLHDRQNFNAVGMEWLMAPLFVLFRTDRVFFLINFASWLFLPGLTFSVFRRLEVSGRIAWSWMWILPTGLCFILQAASMGNDLFAAVYFLAALHYALATRPDKPGNLALSILCMALLTGAKATNIPLGLPWLVVLWHHRGAVLPAVRTILLVAVLVIGLAVSFIPIAIANIHFTGTYTGDPTNNHRVQITNPVIGIAGNSVEIALGNLAPPLWPHDFHWPDEASLSKAFKPAYPRFMLDDMPFQIEENAGLGLGVSAFWIASFFYGLRGRLSFGSRTPPLFVLLFAGTTLIASLAFMAKLGSEAAPRLFAVYYVALIAAALLVLPPEGRVIHRLAWKGLACASLAVSFLLIILNPSRPLVPVPWILGGLRLFHAPEASIVRLQENFRLREVRRDGLETLRLEIPATENVIGCLSGMDDLEVSPWLPFGSRQVVEVSPTTDLAARHIRYVVVNFRILEKIYHLTLPELLAKWPLKVAAQEDVTFTTKRGTDTWLLLAPL